MRHQLTPHYISDFIEVSRHWDDRSPESEKSNITLSHGRSAFIEVEPSSSNAKNSNFFQISRWLSPRCLCLLSVSKWNNTHGVCHQAGSQRDTIFRFDGSPTPPLSNPNPNPTSKHAGLALEINYTRSHEVAEDRHILRLTLCGDARAMA